MCVSEIDLSYSSLFYLLIIIIIAFNNFSQRILHFPLICFPFFLNDLSLDNIFKCS